jgi:hypothetical protein
MSEHERPRLFQFSEIDDVATKFEPYPLKQIPLAALREIERRNFRSDTTTLEHLGSAFKLDFGDAGSAAILAYYREKYGGLNKSFEVYAADISRNGELMGVGASSLEVDPVTGQEGVPFVVYTHTERPFLSLGLGLRRLIVLNQANKQLFNLPLHSGAALEPEAEKLWQRLEQEGLTIKEGPRYRFK